MNCQILYNKKTHFCDLLSVKFIIILLTLSISLCIFFLLSINHTTVNSFANFELPNINHTLLNKLETQKNLIFIGDVHGAFDELLELIKKINYDPLRDHLIFVGDLVAKGPKSIEVINLVRSLGASCVRGNHDDKVLRWKGYLDSIEALKINLDESIKQGNVSESVIKEFESGFNISEAVTMKSEHGLIAKKLDLELYSYLLSCPIILDISEHNLFVVHAGLLPDVPFSEQKPFDIMNMRNIDDNGKPTKDKKGHSWSKYWNTVQKRFFSPKTVIYGHDASRGLKIKPYSFGLDSGCVYGGKLSALMWNDNKKIVNVKCKHYAD